MLHVWLGPALAVLALLLAALYLCVRHYGGGDGVRRDGRCVCDEAEEEETDESTKTYQFICPP